MSEIYTDNNCELDAITHSGIIKNMNSRKYFISITPQSACTACHVKSVCNVTELNDEIVEVPRTGSEEYKTGDKVEILMEKSLGTKAVFLGYIAPFLLVLATLLITLNLFKSQGVAGLISIGILAPYYFILYLNRKVLKKTFTFRLR